MAWKTAFSQVCIAFLAIYGVSAEDSLEELSAIPFGLTTSVGWCEDHAVYGIGHGIAVVDVSDPEHPVTHARVPMPGYVSSVSVHQSTVFAASGEGGIVEVDLGVPMQPIVQNIYDTPGVALASVTDGDRLFVADGENGLVVFERGVVTDRPHIVDLPGFSTCVAVFGGFAFVGTEDDGLHVVDISQPGGEALFDTLDMNAFGLAVQGTWLHVASGPEGLRILDISDPEMPVQVSGFATETDAKFVLVEAGTVFLVEVTYSDGLLHLIDVRDPLSPVLISTTEFRGNGGFTVEADRVFLSGWMRSHIVDVTDLIFPSVVGHYFSYSAGDVEVQGDRMIVSLGRGPSDEVVYGVTTLTRDEHGRYSERTTLEFESLRSEFEIVGDYLFAVGSDSLRIFELSESDEILEVGSIQLSQGDGLEVRDGVAYVREYRGVRMFDVSSVEAPVEVAFLSTEHLPYFPPGEILIVDDFLYIGFSHAFFECFAGKLVAYDISSPFEPVLVEDVWATSPLAFFCDPARETLFVFGSAGCLDSYPVTVRSFDIRDRAHPVNIGESYTALYNYDAEDLSVLGNRAIVTGGGELHIVDLRYVQMWPPTVIEGSFRGTTVHGGLVLAADWYRGVLTFDPSWRRLPVHRSRRLESPQ